MGGFFLQIKTVILGFFYKECTSVVKLFKTKNKQTKAAKATMLAHDDAAFQGRTSEGSCQRPPQWGQQWHL